MKGLFQIMKLFANRHRKGTVATLLSTTKTSHAFWKQEEKNIKSRIEAGIFEKNLITMSNEKYQKSFSL